MSTIILQKMLGAVQVDIGGRGLQKDRGKNLVTETRVDFEKACADLANHPAPHVAIVTGFYILSATPPAAETDGPPGAVFLARAITELGGRVTVLCDEWCTAGIDAGLAAHGISKGSVSILTLPGPAECIGWKHDDYWRWLEDRTEVPTHLVAIEHVGPCHDSDKCFSARGRDLSEYTSPVHLLFEDSTRRPLMRTIGIGDGGNEIGMGKISRDVIEANIPLGRTIACRTPTDWLIVAGISNWGAYALAAGFRLLKGAPLSAEMFDRDQEYRVIESMVRAGPLVDGMTGTTSVTVDGIDFDRYAECLTELGRLGRL
jgi:D-glutamate cyclase